MRKANIQSNRLNIWKTEIPKSAEIIRGSKLSKKQIYMNQRINFKYWKRHPKDPEQYHTKVHHATLEHRGQRGDPQSLQRKDITNEELGIRMGTQLSTAKQNSQRQWTVSASYILWENNFQPRILCRDNSELSIKMMTFCQVYKVSLLPM